MESKRQEHMYGDNDLAMAATQDIVEYLRSLSYRVFYMNGPVGLYGSVTLTAMIFQENSKETIDQHIDKFDHDKYYYFIYVLDPVNRYLRYGKLQKTFMDEVYGVSIGEKTKLEDIKN